MLLGRSKRILALIILSWVFFIFVVLINLVPRYEFKSITGQELDPIEVDSSIVFDQQWFLDYEYDLTKLDNGSYLLSLTNNQIYCYSWGETCLSAAYSAGSIQLLDSDYQTIWKTGDENSAHPGIEFDDIKFIPFGSDQLTDGSIVSIGKSIDSVNDVFNVTLLFFDINGNPTSYQHIDLKDKSIINSGHAELEVLKTENGGFTVQISGLHIGSVIIHYNASYLEEWQFIAGGSRSIDTDDYLSNIHYINFTYYSLVGNSITAIRSDGSFKWSKIYDFNITGFDLTDDGKIVLSGVSNTSYVTMDSLIETKNWQRNIAIYHVGVLNEGVGTFDWRSEYRTFYSESGMEYYARYTVTDLEGNYYTLIQILRNDFIDTDYAILKHSSTGEYIGQSIFSDSLQSHLEFDRFQSHNYKIDLVINQDELNILVPNFLYVKSIDLTEVDWNPSSPIPFNLTLYNRIIYLRIWTNRVSLIVLISGVGYFFIRMLMKKEKPADYCEDPVSEQ